MKPHIKKVNGLWYCGYHTKESKYVKWMGRTTPKAALDFHITIAESIKSWSKPASRGY